MSATPPTTAPSETKPTALYYVPFQILGGVYVRAENPNLALEYATDGFGTDELVRSGAVESLDFDHKWGPGITEAGPNDTETEAPCPPSIWYEVHAEKRGTSEGDRAEQCFRSEDGYNEPYAYSSEEAAREAIEEYREASGNLAPVRIERVTESREIVGGAPSP